MAEHWCAGCPEWPDTPEALVAIQAALAEQRPEAWRPHPAAVVGASYVCFAGSEVPVGSEGVAGEAGWGAVAHKSPGERARVAVVGGLAGAPYRPGLLALREGPLRSAAARLLPLPDVLLVDATGRDHPRQAGLALHLGAVLGVASVGITNRPLIARGQPPADRRGATSPLRLGGELVGFWLRTRAGVRPVAVSAGWSTDAEAAVEIVLAATRRTRTPQPLREARRAARHARARRGG